MTGIVALLLLSKFQQPALTALPDLGTKTYQGEQGGLYPNGKNTRPPAHEKAGLEEAKNVVPRDSNGNPSPTGKIGLITIGMSNTRQEGDAWGAMLRRDPEINPQLVFANCAQGGQTASKTIDEKAQFWTVVDQTVKQAGITNFQVQAVWLKQADAGPTSGWPTYAKTLSTELGQLARIIRKRFPNSRLCYLSSRIYGGYAKTKLNPEPYAYESGFSVKWCIQEQINGSASLAFAKNPVAPWLSWGPYIWGDATKWSATDFGNDGTHPSRTGADKVAKMLMDFFKSDSTTKNWFLKPK